MSQTRTTATGRAGAIVTDREGLRGRIDTSDVQPRVGGRPAALVHLEGGRQAIVPVDALVAQDDGSYMLPLSLSEFVRPPLEQARQGDPALTNDEQTIVAPARTREAERIVMPVVAETLDVQKRKVETGGVRIKKVVHEREEIVDEPLMREEVQVKRVPINRIVEAPVPVRHVGNTMIISLLEEVLVVEKRLMLKEELHITKGEIETYKPQRVLLRSEEAFVERVDDADETLTDTTLTDAGTNTPHGGNAR